MGCKGSKVKRISIDQTDTNNNVNVVPLRTSNKEESQYTNGSSFAEASSHNVISSNSCDSLWSGSVSIHSDGSRSLESLIRSLSEFSRHLRERRNRPDPGLEIRQLYRCEAVVDLWTDASQHSGNDSIGSLSSFNSDFSL